MSLETKLYTLLSAQCARTYPDFAPSGATLPFVTWQNTGGDAITFVGRETPTLRNSEIQISVYAATRLEANALSLAIENALTTASTLQAKPMDALVGTYEPDTKRYGAVQIFSIWDTR